MRGLGARVPKSSSGTGQENLNFVYVIKTVAHKWVGEIEHGEDIDMHDLVWIKSSYSYANSNCVEVCRHPDGQVEVRNSRFPNLRLPSFTGDEWDAFISGINAGEFLVVDRPAASQ